MFRRLFTRFVAPTTTISDRDAHFYNQQFAKVLKRFGVTHKVAIL